MNQNAEPLKKLMDECVDGSTLADVLGVCRETLIRLGDRKQIPFFKVGSKRLYHVPAVMEAMKE